MGSNAQAEQRTAQAIFAGGCFWCMEKPFEQVEGVVEVIAGYTGGSSTDPHYKDYARGGHVEAIRIVYDPAVIGYDELLEIFWRQIDPTDAGGQFVDRGPEYRSVIFYADEEQRAAAQRSKEALGRSGRFDEPIVTEISPAGPFYQAEQYHQNYYKTHPLRYKFYRHNSGRDQFLQKVWGSDKPGTRKK